MTTQQTPVGRGGYEYGGGAIPPDEPPVGGGGYGYGGYPYGGGGGMDLVEEHYHLMNHKPEVGGIDREDMTVTFLPLKRTVSPN
jgi:hypothetical protein